MNCNMGRGKLLIPLGSGRDWLLNNHNSLTFTITKGGKTLPVPNVKKVEMLKKILMNYSILKLKVKKIIFQNN